MPCESDFFNIADAFVAAAHAVLDQVIDEIGGKVQTVQEIENFLLIGPCQRPCHIFLRDKEQFLNVLADCKLGHPVLCQSIGFLFSDRFFRTCQGAPGC